MGLLFLQLMNKTDRMETAEKDKQQKLVIDVLSYIEAHYRDGDLNSLARQLHYDTRWLSKEIKKRTGQNYTACNSECYRKICRRQRDYIDN